MHTPRRPFCSNSQPKALLISRCKLQTHEDLENAAPCGKPASKNFCSVSPSDSMFGQLFIKYLKPEISAPAVRARD